MALLLVALSGCMGSDGSTSSTQPLRTDTEWVLEGIEPDAGSFIAVTDPELYTIRFRADGTVDARADCNRCGGSYRVAGASLTMGPLACTLAACQPGSLSDRYVAALSRVSSYVQTPDKLVLTYSGGHLHFRARS